MRDGTRVWKQTVKHALAVLTDLDPYGLEPGAPGGAPADEYDLEAEPIARHLVRDGAISADELDAIWLHCFGEPLSEVIGPASMSDVVARLNAAFAAPLPDVRPSAQ